MNVYPILSAKLPNEVWKRCHILDKHQQIKKSIYSPTDETMSKLTEIYRLVFTRTYNNLKINESAVYEYILKLNDFRKKRLTEKEEKEIDFVENFITGLSDYYIIRGKYTPQIVINEKQGRVFMHPLFNWKDKWVHSLFKKFNFIDMPNHVMIKFDVNGALLRILLYLMGKSLNNDGLIKLSKIGGDIYEIFLNNILKGEYDVERNFVKRTLISMICGSEGKKLLSYDNNLINQIKHYATMFGSDYIFKCTNLFVMTQIVNMSKMYDDDLLLPLINVDGGYFLVPDDDKKLETLKEKLPYFNFEKI